MEVVELMGFVGETGIWEAGMRVLSRSRLVVSRRAFQSGDLGCFHLLQALWIYELSLTLTPCCYLDKDKF